MTPRPSKAGDRLRRLVQTALVDRAGPLTPQLSLADTTSARLAPERTTTVVCGYCSTGCGLEAHLRTGGVVNLSPAPSYPVNAGAACPKGWEALAPLRSADRATMPLVRGERGRMDPISWPAALELMAKRLKGIQARHGKHAAAFVGTGQIVTEELAFLGALAKFGMGMLDGDGNTRQCMATAAAAYEETFGFDAPPFTYRDFEESDVIVLVGSNVVVTHPILWERISRNGDRPRIVVIDPRRTETAARATDHFPIRPKGDLPFFYALGNVLCENGWIDRRFIERNISGFEAYRAHVARFPPEKVAAEAGIAAPEIRRLARLIHDGERVSFWWTMGVNQSHEGVRVAQAIIALSLVTGNIGRPGTGANSITGQCNAMGARLFSNTSNLLGGHDFANPTHRRKVAQVLELDEAAIPTEASASYDRILEKIAERKIRALWVVGTNPAHSLADQGAAREVLSRLDFLVVQDMYTATETARMAHLVLPAAGWGEKGGTLINSERRIGLAKKIVRAPGQALPDFHIFRLVAEAWGCGPMFRRWTSPEAVFQILKELTRGQPCDVTGIDGYATLDRAGGIQWPLPEGARPEGRERRLFEDGRFFHPDGKARLVVEEPRAVPELPCAEYPFVLLTGRGSPGGGWETNTRTGKTAALRPPGNETYVEISPADARKLALVPNEEVNVSSRRATIRARAHVTASIKPGEVFIAMHGAAVNRLTLAAYDPSSRQPAYKHCAVKVERATA